MKLVLYPFRLILMTMPSKFCTLGAVAFLYPVSHPHGVARPELREIGAGILGLHYLKVGEVVDILDAGAQDVLVIKGVGGKASGPDGAPGTPAGALRAGGGGGHPRGAYPRPL